MNNCEKEFIATKLTSSGERGITVCTFNDLMAVCGDSEGPVLISKEQAMKFFNLKECDNGN